MKVKFVQRTYDTEGLDIFTNIVTTDLKSVPMVGHTIDLKIKDESYYGVVSEVKHVLYFNSLDNEPTGVVKVIFNKVDNKFNRI